MQRFGYKPGERGHVSRDIVPLPIPLLFRRKQKLHQGYAGCTAHSWTHTPAWQLAGGTAKSPTAPHSTHSSPHGKEPNGDMWNSLPWRASALRRRDATGMPQGMPWGWEELTPAPSLPGRSWAQRKKLLFSSPFWKWPKSSNIIYQKCSI